MSNAALSLRERNRIDCWHAIHDAAADLTIERGLDETTIDAISERAGVSRRTFFNYFPSKEDAVLGMQAPTIPDGAVSDFRTGEGDSFGRTMRLMLAVLDSAIPDHDDFPRRRTLAERHPVLEERLRRHISAAEDIVLSILSDPDGEVRAESRSGDIESAKALLSLAATILRFTSRNDPHGILVDREAAINRSIDVFRKAISEAL
ncbi:TetR family transcriptional regulator [Pseudoclavibacter helvolus]|uniref:TetR family transcriptional regulator n=1 Tax=Pseudoclavibacter helvolus TaxID=255205 RepID=UPI003C7955CD